MRQIFGDIGWEKKAAVFFVSVLLLAIIGPFATYEDMPFLNRLVFWFITFAGVGFFMHVMMKLALSTKYLRGQSRFLRLAIGAAFGALPGAAVVVFVNGVFRPGDIRPETLPSIWMQVTAIGYLVGLVEYIDWRETITHIPGLARTQFHKRLPAEIGDDIISLSMQDHYVEVTTTRDKQLVLIRLSDAIDELDGLDGLRIHRSHWVARRHLTGMERLKTKATAQLSDGRTLPVSASYLDNVTAELTAA